MKIEINRQVMLEAARTVARVAPTNSPVEALNGILVEGDSETGEVFLTATNYEVSIQQKVHASVEESGTILVDARLLAGMMSALKGDLVSLSADKPQLLTVIGGKCTYKIKCLPSRSYPKPVMPFPDESVLMTGICSLAKRTTFAASKDTNKPALQCVQVKLKNNAVHAAACDSMRMMLIKDVSDTTAEQEFLLPGRALHLLASISSDDDVFEVSDIGNEIVFVRGDMIFSIHKLVAGDYMDTNAVVKSLKPVYSAVADSTRLKEGLDLISVGAISASSSGSKEPLNLVLSSDSRPNGEIILRCNSSYADASIAVPAVVPKGKETPNGGFFYNISALTRLLQVIKGKIKIEIDAKGFILVKTRNEVYFQAPIRPRVKSEKPSAQVSGKNSSQSEQEGVTKKTKRAKGAEDVKEVA